MEQLLRSEIEEAGSILGALENRSIIFMNRLLEGHVSGCQKTTADKLQRTIVHANPHLDEYFAEFIFRACQTARLRNCDFLEQILYSDKVTDFSEQLWSTSAVFGFGSSYLVETPPLFLFDEHVVGQKRSAKSCSNIVVEKMLSSVPRSIKYILDEVSEIDDSGGAHTQHLANLIKTFHFLRNLTGQDGDGNDARVSAVFSPKWMRSIVDIILTSTIFCIENNFDLIGNIEEKRTLLLESFKSYLSQSPRKGTANFDRTVNWIERKFSNQEDVFRNALLKNKAGLILDSHGIPVPQILVLGRICFSIQKTFDRECSDLIMSYFWESEVKKQIDFFSVCDALDELPIGESVESNISFGKIFRYILPQIRIFLENQKDGKTKKIFSKIMIIYLLCDSNIVQPNKALLHYINQRNRSCGLVLIRNSSNNSVVLMKCSAIDEKKWNMLVELIEKQEPGIWHVTRNERGIAPFINNGNMAHQEGNWSTLDGFLLANLVRKVFY